MERTFQITLTETQLKALADAADNHARMMIGQVEVMCDEISGPMAHFWSDAHERGDSVKIWNAMERFKGLLTGFAPHQSHGIRNPHVPEKARCLFDMQKDFRNMIKEK